MHRDGGKPRALQAQSGIQQTHRHRVGDILGRTLDGHGLGHGFLDPLDRAFRADDFDRLGLHHELLRDVPGGGVALDGRHNRHDPTCRALEGERNGLRGDLHDLDAKGRAHLVGRQLEEPMARACAVQIQHRCDVTCSEAAERHTARHFVGTYISV